MKAPPKLSLHTNRAAAFGGLRAQVSSTIGDKRERARLIHGVRRHQQEYHDRSETYICNPGRVGNLAGA